MSHTFLIGTRDVVSVGTGVVPNYCSQRLSPDLDGGDGSLCLLTPINVFVILGNFTNVKVITDS